jgi:hypothetical protein
LEVHDYYVTDFHLYQGCIRAFLRSVQSGTFETDANSLAEMQAGLASLLDLSEL